MGYELIALVASNLLALAAYWYLPRWCARLDYKAIEEDGAKDSLKKRFHFWRAVWRGVGMLIIALLGALPYLLEKEWVSTIFQVVGLFAVGACYFLYDFNPRLSRLRGLDPYYVSSDPEGAVFDRMFWGEANATSPAGATYEQVKARAAELLRKSLRNHLIAGSLLYVQLTILAI